MKNDDIPKEFYDVVERVAQQVTRKWPSLEWEDTRQDIWVELLSSPNMLDNAVSSDNPAPLLRMLASRTVSSSFQSNELAQGSYEYGTKEIRKLLEQGIIQNPNDFTLTQTTQIAEAMLKLHDSNKNYYDYIVDRFVHNKNPDRKNTTRAVDKLTDLVNRWSNSQASEGHYGPGARKVLSNNQAKILTSTGPNESSTPSWAIKFIGKKRA